MRECEDCGYRGPTVEVFADFVFNRVDDDARERTFRNNARKMLKAGFSMPKQRPQQDVPDDLMLIDLTNQRMPRSDSGRRELLRNILLHGLFAIRIAPAAARAKKCRKNVHLMTKSNTYVTSQGHKVCRACRELTRVAYSNTKREEINARRRRWHAKNRERINARQRELRAVKRNQQHQEQIAA